METQQGNNVTLEGKGDVDLFLGSVVIYNNNIEKDKE